MTKFIYIKVNGFTVLELLLAVSVFSLISVASVSLVFSGLNIRDQARASLKTQEQLRVFSQTLRAAVVGAKIISGGGGSLLITGSDVCWSFIHDGGIKNIRFSKVVGVGCIPDPSPQSLFFPYPSQIQSFAFALAPLPTGGRQVAVDGNLKVILPFDDYEVDFSDTFTNLID